MVIKSGYFGTSSDNILRIDNIASKEEMDLIVNTAENMDIWNASSADNTLSNTSDHEKLRMLSPETYKLILKIRNNFSLKISEFYNVSLEPQIRFPLIFRWFVGNDQTPHYDTEHYPNYNIGSIVYLNDQYEGGEIYFPQHDIEIRPISGNAFAFPGDEYYMHGVREITNGFRYTLPFFWKVIEDD